MADQVESTKAEITRDVDSQVSEADTAASANERMSREVEDSSRPAEGRNTQQECIKELSDEGFSWKGFKNYAARMSDPVVALVLDKTGYPESSTHEDRIGALRRSRLADCMREKDKK